MAIVTSTDYDHIDVVDNDTTRRHPIKDASARERLEPLETLAEALGLSVADGVVCQTYTES